MMMMIEVLKRVYTRYQESRSDWQHLDSKHKVLNKARTKPLQAGGTVKIQGVFCRKYTGFLGMKPIRVKK